MEYAKSSLAEYFQAKSSLIEYFQACCPDILWDTPDTSEARGNDDMAIQDVPLRNRQTEDLPLRDRLQELPKRRSRSVLPVGHVVSDAEEVELEKTPDLVQPCSEPNSADGARSSRRLALCQEAWSKAGGSHTGFVDMTQNEEGLSFVFEQLGDVPVPQGYWYVQVFQNFDSQGSGRLDFESFAEIVEQWDAHCSERRSELSYQETTFSGREANESSPFSMFETGRSDDIVSIVDLIKEAGELLQDQQPMTAPPAPVHRAPARPRPVVGGSEMETSPRRAGLHHSRRMAAANQWQPVRRRVHWTAGRRWKVSFSPTFGRFRKRLGGRALAAGILPEVMFPTYVGRLAIFDEYDFLGIIGQGACGKVLAVRHRQSKQTRACKVATVRREQERDLVDNEVGLLKSLNHPNIMNLHEVYFESPSNKRTGSIYLVTELCRGGDLLSRIAYHYEWLKQPMTEGHVAYMMRQILSATRYCHDLGVIHRDIKPQNILFVNRHANSPIKIIDFGLANFTERIRMAAVVEKVPRSGALGRLARLLPAVRGKELLPRHVRTQIMQRAGTPHYMAPELIAGRYNEKADLFSIGVVFCELLSGVHPFFVPGVDDETSAKAKITSREPVRFPCEALPGHQVSKVARDLCLALLRKCPKRRLGAHQAVAHPWFRNHSKFTPYGHADRLSTSIFDDLARYQGHNKLKRAVLQLLSRELSEGQIEDARGKFSALDTQGDGLLTPEELKEGARRIGYDLKRPELKQIVAALDCSGSGSIGYKEFVSALVAIDSGFDEGQLKDCFRKFDAKGVGHITYEDVRTVLCCGDDEMPAITRSEWEEIASPSDGKIQPNLGGASKKKASTEPLLTFDAFVQLMQPNATHESKDDRGMEIKTAEVREERRDTKEPVVSRTDASDERVTPASPTALLSADISDAQIASTSPTALLELAAELLSEPGSKQPVT